MRLLLDTHALLWHLLGNDRLSITGRQAIDDPRNEILVSAVSAMELSTKYRLGKLPEAKNIAGSLATLAPRMGFKLLSISAEHGDMAGGFSFPHRDPFDRLLIAQAQIEQAWLVSNEALFDQFGVRRLW